MKRLKRIEKAGYKVTAFMSGTGAQATKGNVKLVESSITALHTRIFGY